jgi:hypothetical protein
MGSLVLDVIFERSELVCPAGLCPVQPRPESVHRRSPQRIHTDTGVERRVLLFDEGCSAQHP